MNFVAKLSSFSGLLRILAIGGMVILFAYAQNDADEASPSVNSAAVSASRPAYRLKPGDTIEIRLFFNPELNEQVLIRPDGRIWLHLIGEVEVAGKSVQDTASMMEALYVKELRTPKVSIQVRGFAEQKVFVTGEVVRPGLLNLPGNMTVFDAINEAGGIKHTGDDGAVILIEKDPDGNPVGRKLALFKKGQPTADASIPLHPFDVVMVPETKVAHLDRWIDQHIRQVIPVNTSAGFTYLISRQTSGGGVPIF